MAFSSHFDTSSGTTIVQLSGALDEHAQLPTIPAGTEIHVDLEKLTYLNSVGVRLWIRWVADVTKNTKMILIRCPALFVKNFSSIRGMLNRNTLVQSFYVPYYDDKYDERKNVLYIRGREFLDDGTLNMPTLKNANGDVMEPDVIEQTYFSFLKI